MKDSAGSYSLLKIIPLSSSCNTYMELKKTKKLLNSFSLQEIIICLLACHLLPPWIKLQVAVTSVTADFLSEDKGKTLQQTTLAKGF